MKLFYNANALHDLARSIVLLNEHAVPFPPDSTTQWQHTLKVRLWFTEQSWADNRALIEEVKTHLQSGQEVTLKLTDDNDTVWIEQTAKVTDADHPENPNARGKYLQALDVTFQYFENLDSAKTGLLSATFQRVGVNAPVQNLGQIEGCKREFDSRRFDPLRSHRDLATGRISLRGRILGNMQDTVSERRLTLLATLDALYAELKTGTEGKIKYGTVFGNDGQTCRVDNFMAELDNGPLQKWIGWSMTLSYTEFPNESGYAQAQFSVRTREESAQGKLFLSFAGAIGAHTKAHALAKLATVRTSVLNAAGGSFIALNTSSTAEELSVEDGDTFIKLTFEEEYQKAVSSIVESQLRVQDAEEVTSGRLRRTYSGSVTAKAATFDAAYQAATDKARALGDNKHQLKRSGTLNAEDPQLSYDRVTSGDILVRVEFSFEYELKGARVYLELNSEYNHETFGADVEQVSGFIVAGDAATARALYSTILTGYATFLIRNERLTEARQKIATASGVPVGQVESPPNAGSWGANVNAGEVSDATAEASSSMITNPPLLGTGYTRQWVRLEFGFQVHRIKASGQANCAMRYEFSVFRDFATREKTTTLSGTVWADTGPTPAGGTDTATIYLDAFLSALSLGKHKQSQRSSSREKAALGGGLGSASDLFMALNFTETFTDQLSDASAIFQCEVEEEIQCSGTRVVVQPTARDKDVMQECGTQSGRRTISGVIRAVDETTCFAWVAKQRSMPLPVDAIPAGARKSLPPVISIKPEFVELTEGYGRTGNYGTEEKTANAKAITMRFRFEEVFTELTLPI